MISDQFTRPERSPRVTLLTVALATCAGYYLGSLIGLQLRLLPATTSVLWPSNAILTSALVLTPPKRWAAVLLAVLPVHVLIQYPTGWPLPLILALFVTNCLEALIAAIGMRFLSDTPWRFDTLRALTAFYVAAVLIAPPLSSFADAAAVHWFRGEPYWHVWGDRSVSNVLAELTVVPAMVGIALGVVRWWRRGMPAPRFEAIALGLTLSGIAWINLTDALTWAPSLSALSSYMPLAIQLPFLLWAAMRFGPTGTGIAVLLTTLVRAWAIVHGIGSFGFVSPSTTVTALTLSLIVVAAPLLCLATLIEERSQTQRTLRMRLEFESLLSRLSSALVQEPSEQMTRTFESWLGRIAWVLGIDRLTVFTVSTAAAAPTLVYTWTDEGARADDGDTARHHAEWAQRSFVDRDMVQISGDDETPLRGARHTLEPTPFFKAGGAIALVGQGQPLGALAFSSLREPPSPSTLLSNVWLVGEVVAAALHRKQSEEALQKSEGMKSAILQSLTSGVAVLDRVGSLLQFNSTWVHESRGREWMKLGIGANLLQACWTARDAGDRLAAGVAEGVAGVLAGTRDRFTVEQLFDPAGDARWWSLNAVPLHRPEGGAVLVCDDITDLRRAELEAQRSRQELAQVSRVSTVGEMTASLAHQLNQPLAAIMTNAQAAGRILNASVPDVDEVRQILQDIVRDDRRASDVIQRLSQLLRKGELEMTVINLTAAIREVVDLISTEAITRTIGVSFDFAEEPVFATAERVQLQQVILNLLYNAMEAMVDQHEYPRRIVIACRQDRGLAVVSVRDSGPGLRAGTEEVVFEPFFTTKSGGMGMGLSIVRSIVEAHGGRIHAANAATRGTVVEFQLPAASLPV